MRKTTAAGAIAFVLGGALLFDAPGLNTPWVTLVGLALFMAAFTFFAGVKGLAAQRKPSITGSEGLIGQHAQVKQSFASGETGSVFVAGEWWNAQLIGGEEQDVVTVTIGEEVEIVGRKGYTLLVKRVG